MSKGVSVAYVNAYVTDLERLMKFFGQVVGLDLQHGDPNFGYASFDAGPIRLGLAQIDSEDENQRVS